MAKMKLFGLLFSFFNLLLINWTPILASNAMKPARLEQCNLPAPDSFRITQVGGDLIKLAWNPIFPGAQHQLVIMESDGNGGYVTILVENNVSGDTYNANNLLPGTSYRFVIATKCASGDPSEIKSIIDGITLIVDLAIEGRKPVNPIPTGNCEFIPKGYNWVGFRIFTISGDEPLENYFEFVPNGIEVTNQNFSTKFVIKRHFIDHPIVASNELNFWPNCDEELVKAWNGIVRIDRLISGGIDKEIIGFLDIGEVSNPPSYYICPDYDHPIYPWKSNYFFTPMVSTKVSPPQNCGERSESHVESNYFPRQQTIFSDFLTVNLEDAFLEREEVDVCVTNNFGQVIFHDHLVIPEPNFQLNTSTWTNGGYIININSKKNSFNFLAVKLE